MDHIYKHISDKSKKCLSVVVVCVLAPAYTSLFRVLKYSPKVRYIWQHCPMSEKQNYKNERHNLAFGSTYLHRMYA